MSMKGDAGLFCFRLEPDGRLCPEGELRLPAPMYACQRGDRLYLALREPFGEAQSGVIAVDCENGVPVRAVGEPADCDGRIACHIAASPDGKRLYTANYRSGTVSVFALDETGAIAGRVGKLEFPSPPEKPAHAHGIFFTADGGTLCAPDLGGDCIRLYREERPAGEVRLPEGSGPRHMVMSPDGNYAYLVCQNSSEVYGFEYGADGWTGRSSVKLEAPAGVKNQASAIRISPDGGWLFVSNRGADTVSTLRADRGRVSRYAETPCGRNPRDMDLSPDGRWLVLGNMDDDTVAVYSVDGGRLSCVSQTKVTEPVAVLFVKGERYEN